MSIVTELKVVYYTPAKIHEAVPIVDLVRGLASVGLTVTSKPGGIICIHRIGDKV